jgi:hypothetical protein
MGRVVDRLEGFAGHPGIQNMNWIPSAGIRSGIYFYRIGGDMDTTLSGRMTFVR